MFKNYLILALRNIYRKATFSFINVIGLATALATVIFIATWVYDELTFDTFYPNKENIYRVVAEAGAGEDRWHQAVTSLPLGPAMENTIPEVTGFVRLDRNDAVVTYKDNIFKEDHIVLTDPSFFDVFSYDLQSGNKETALSEPYQVVITESVARKYFGKNDPLGESLHMFMYDPEGKGADYKITGVMKDPPDKSHFTFDILGSISTIESVDPEAMTVWDNNSYYTYVTLDKKTTANQLEAKLPELVQSELGDRDNVYFRFYLQPVASIHLHSNIQYEFMGNGRMDYVVIFSAIGILTLILAIINYINLTTSFSLDRAREIGVRKVMGALKPELIRQHLTETITLCLISAGIAVLIVLGFEMWFQQLTGKNYLVFDPLSLTLKTLALALPLGIIAGYFPARMLAGFNALKSLKGNVTFKSRNSFRLILVAFQFMTTFLILVGVIVVQNQLHFIQNQDLGYDKNNLLVLRTNGSPEVPGGFEAFKQELLSSSLVTNVARSGSMIVGGLGNSNGRVTKDNGELQTEKIYRVSIDPDYLDTYRIELMAGRNFNSMINSDSTEAFILNESAVKAFGWKPDEAIGKEMSFGGRDGFIIGVVQDFNFNTLHHRIEPACLYIRRGFSRITIRGNDSVELGKLVETTWKKHFPASMYDYTFQDQALHSSYASDQRFSKIFDISFALTIMIALLGLFGLVGHTVRKITKEIGIRKVLGATTLQILQMISYSFIKIILIASFVALPLTWWIMDSWLNGFPYHIQLQPWHFILATGFLVSGALSVILSQSWKASVANPAQTLKDE